MRPNCTPPAISLAAASLALLLSACAPKEPPPPSEYIKLTYTLTPGPTTGDEPLLLPIESGSLSCMRQARSILVRTEDKKKGVSVAIQLNDAATAPAPVYTANNATGGRVNLDVVVPKDDQGKQTVGFNTTDAGDTFTCTLCVSGPDPFALFAATFSCESKDTPNGRLSVRGEARATICPQMVQGEPMPQCIR